jgi:hypothetical protein
MRLFEESATKRVPDTKLMATPWGLKNSEAEPTPLTEPAVLPSGPPPASVSTVRLEKRRRTLLVDSTTYLLGLCGV